MSYYDESLIPLYSATQYGHTGWSGESNPWANYRYQGAFAGVWGNGQYGRQYSPAGAVGPALAPRQPGTWPQNIPAGVIGTMQSTPAELSYMEEPGVVPRLNQMFGFQIPQFVPGPTERQPNAMHSLRSVRRGRQLRGGRYPAAVSMPGRTTPGGPDSLPPPICGQGERAVQVGRGNWRCVHTYNALCPPGFRYNDHYQGHPVCLPPDPTRRRNPDYAACMTACKKTGRTDAQCKAACANEPGAPGIHRLSARPTGRIDPGAIRAARPTGTRAMICQIRPEGKCCILEGGPGALIRCIRELRRERDGNPGCPPGTSCSSGRPCWHDGKCKCCSVTTGLPIGTPTAPGGRRPAMALRARRGKRAALRRVANSPYTRCRDDCIANNQCDSRPDTDACKVGCQRRCDHLRLPSEDPARRAMGLRAPTPKPVPVRRRALKTKGKRGRRLRNPVGRALNQLGTLALTSLVTRAVKNAVLS